MPIYTKEQAQALLKKVLNYSKADECEVSLGGSEGGNVRYALNAVSTAGDISTVGLSVTSVYGKKAGSATIDQFDDASLERVVRRSEELAQLAPENSEYMPMLGPSEFKESITYNANTAAMTPESRADMVGKSLQASKNAKLFAAGFLENSTGFNAVMNSKGLFAYNKSSDVTFSVTTRNEGGTTSGYAARGFTDVSKLDTASATRVACMKANASVGAKALEPGKYTVILEPVAATYMLENMFRFDARSAEEGRSFLSKKGGGTRLGEQLVDPKVTIYSDPFNPDLPSSTWTGDGLPREKTMWIDKGVVKNLSYSRFWAQKKGVAPTPGPGNIIMEGGTQSLEDLIKGTERGILVSRLWYIRMVDPQSLLLTGLTRDGTFYIENGKIMFPVKNFRFNESPVIMLNNLEALGKQERSISVESYRSYLIPPMKIRDFTFSSLSDAV
ncbi:TldD/PmbA family protein [Mucilaginibacter phyllosphaerae]|uniref:TldD/PmbA family protein n=1 Tax=Mucilaginibacter phyllosphaerae TaxID=1812349 RepID=A0A4Y8AFF5_9SPHI|nr:TldD/PmbA family protein [Mucilaginibacter phyllosphaerae]MBB3968865.1 putative Zn-dependent protease [Mucilaginibacter phyllosphaerae]TEW67506.1 TldD/PmbA family protein [Mucilaginibacter phyllosphaerae]GGH13444.1 TldD protein [Mucilaginibacter phyllosphaerae]